MCLIFYSGMDTGMQVANVKTVLGAKAELNRYCWIQIFLKCLLCVLKNASASVLNFFKTVSAREDYNSELFFSKSLDFNSKQKQSSVV